MTPRAGRRRRGGRRRPRSGAGRGCRRRRRAAWRRRRSRRRRWPSSPGAVRSTSGRIAALSSSSSSSSEATRRAEGADRQQRRVAHRVGRAGPQRRRLPRSAGPPTARRSGVRTWSSARETQVAQLVQRDDPFRRRRPAGHLSTRIASTSPSRLFGRPKRLTRQRGAGGGHGVDRVGLALPVTDLPVRAIDLDHRDPGPVQLAGQPGPIRAGALDADQLDLAVRAQPADQPLGSRPRSCRTPRCRAPRRGDRPPRPRAHRRGCRRPRSPNMSSLRWSSPSLPVATGSRVGTHLPGGCREPGTVGARPGTVPHPTGECRLRAGRRIVRRTTRRRQPIHESDRPGDGTDRRHHHRSRRWIPRPEHPHIISLPIRLLHSRPLDRHGTELDGGREHADAP